MKWGWYQSLVSLSNNDITKFKAVEELNYAECFTKLIFDMEKQEAEEIELKNNRR